MCGGVSGAGRLVLSHRAGPKHRLKYRAADGIAAILLVGGIANSIGPRGIRPLVVKGNQIEPATSM